MIFKLIFFNFSSRTQISSTLSYGNLGYYVSANPLFKSILIIPCCLEVFDLLSSAWAKLIYGAIKIIWIKRDDNV